MFDIVINNGHVVDPDSKISSKLSIGIQNGKISAISKKPLIGERKIDAEGLIVAPGFIDMHMHEDPYNEEDDSFEFCITNSMLNMGVTTAIGGNCGLGPKDPARYMDAVERKGYPINFAMYVPHESLRNSFGDYDKYKSVDRKTIEKMSDMLQELLNKGFVGLSMGIEYMPGIDEHEAIALMKIAAGKNKPVAVHQRGDAKQAIASVEELINYAKTTGASLQISHISSMNSFGQMEETLSIIDYNRSQGLDIGFDCYPYYAFCTYIGSAVFDDGFLGKYNLSDDGYSRLQMTSGELEGKRCTKETFESLRKSDPKALIVAYLLDEEEVDMALTHPASIVVSDGLFSGGKGHPRASGTFPRLINEYVNKKKLLTLESAIEKITYLPAMKTGLLPKGTLRVGADADVTIFDIKHIEDKATYASPKIEPEGIEYVIIGGEIALECGKIVNRNLGKVIRKY